MCTYSLYTHTLLSIEQSYSVAGAATIAALLGSASTTLFAVAATNATYVCQQTPMNTVVNGRLRGGISVTVMMS